MEKLKTRLDAFSDAIIAIIITIMVLDIPPVLHDTVNNYLQLGKHVGIYLISFIFIANIWYQHSTAFGEIDTMTYRILILDMFFLAPLALMPLLTNMMAVNTTRVTVVMYGALQLLVTFLFRALTRAIVHLEYEDEQAMRRAYAKIYGNANLLLDALAVVALVVGVFKPALALIFYLLYPVLMFLINANARQQMYDVAALPAAQQAEYADLDTAGRKAFREAQTTTFQGPTPAAKPATHLPDTWAHWLDQNVDPRRRGRLQQRFDQATPEQQARMAAWFAARRQRSAPRGNGRSPRH